MHPFDEAIALSRDADGGFLGRTTPAYWNMVGPFGGITAATLLNAVLQHPERLGDPTAMTINFAGPVPEGEFHIQARPVRTNRSTQHWVIEQLVRENGATAVATTATVVTAVRRETWAGSDCPAPLRGGPQPGQEPVIVKSFTPWLQQYALVPLEGSLPVEWDDRVAGRSLSRFWVRKATPRALDFCGLVAACDVFFPRVWLKRARRVPAGTVSMTVYFHASTDQLAACGHDFLLAQATGQEFRNAFSDQSGQLWSQDGLMLATTHQVAYYKE